MFRDSFEDYKKNLVSQFYDANGYLPSNFKELLMFLNEREKVGRRYLYFLDSLGMRPEINYSSAMEVGKGIFDSTGIKSGITLVSPYVLDCDTYICGNFVAFLTGHFVIVNGSNIKYDSNFEGYNRIMTQNPYSKHDYHNWDLLHNSGQHNIVLGVYGSIYDKDAFKKIQSIREFSRLLNDAYVEDYCVDNDSYYCAIGSRRKEKCKVKMLCR